MNRLIAALAALVISIPVLFLMPGCTIQYVVRPEPTPVPFPNAWSIELRVRVQINRISAGLQQGRISQETADILAENDALIRRMVRDYQGPPATRVDLDASQTAFLNGMLADNDRMIDDALQRNQAWVGYFQNGGYDYNSSDHTIYIVFLEYQLNQQQAGVNSGLQSGNLSNSQAKDLRNRIQTIRGMQQKCYQVNGRFDLSGEQVNWLSRMVADNGRYLRFRLQGHHGRWSQDRFSTWKKQTPVALSQGGNGQWGRKQNYTVAKPTPTPIPYQAPPAPTFTPVPVVRPITSAPTSTPTHVSPVAAFIPTNTPSRQAAVAAATNTPTPRPAMPIATYTAPPAAAVPTSTFTPRPVVSPSTSSGGTPPNPPAAPTSTPTRQEVKAVPTVVSPAKPTFTPVPGQAKLNLLPFGQVVSLLKHADNAVRDALKSGQLNDSQTSALNQKLNNLHLKANLDFKKNGANGVTQTQMDELSAMTKDIDQFIRAATESGKDQNTGDSGSKDEKGKGQTNGGGKGEGKGGE